MGDPIPHVTAGQEVPTKIFNLIECYMFAHDVTVQGTVVNAALANDAIDWWNNLEDIAKLGVTIKYRSIR